MLTSTPSTLDSLQTASVAAIASSKAVAPMAVHSKLQQGPIRSVALPVAKSPGRSFDGVMVRSKSPVTTLAAPPQAVKVSSVANVKPAEAKTHVHLTKSVPKLRHQRALRSTASRLLHSQLMSAGLAVAGVIVLLGAGFLALDVWQTNRDAHAAFAVATTSSSGAQNSDAPPSEAPVLEKSKQTYQVAPSMPRMIRIPSLGVDARVFRMMVGRDGDIETPKNIWDTGWYDGSAKPGEVGNAFIDGHISGPTMPAVFAGLKDIKQGAEIAIERGDGIVLKYAVDTVSTQKLDSVNMKSVLANQGGETLTLMTCGGSFRSDHTYDSRVIVRAHRVS